MIAFKISYQLFHYFQLHCFAGYHVGLCSLRVMYIHKIHCFLYTCLLFTHIYYSMYISGGGHTSTYFPAEKLKVSVLSVQCVASTCVRVGMG